MIHSPIRVGTTSPEVGLLPAVTCHGRAFSVDAVPVRVYAMNLDGALVVCVC